MSDINATLSDKRIVDGVSSANSSITSAVNTQGANIVSAVNTNGTNIVNAINNQVVPTLSLPTDRAGFVKTSNPQTLFHSKLIYDTQSLQFDDQQVSGSGTASTWTSPYIVLSVTSGAAGKRVRQSKRRLNYQSGKEQAIKMTTVFGDGKTNIIKRVGYFDDNNGMFLRQNGAEVAFVIRKGGVDYPYLQSAWNKDKLDGFGASGLTLNLSFRQIVVFNFLWLGVDGVSFGFKIGENIIIAHEEVFTNVAGSIGGYVYMNTSNLPLRYEIENVGGVTGTGSELELGVICQEVVSNGGSFDIGDMHSVDRGTTVLSLSDAQLYPLIAIRLRAGFDGVTVTPESVSVICSTTADYRWAMLVNPTFTGTALSWITVTDACIQYATPTNATRINTTGYQARSGYSSAARGSDFDVTFSPFFALGTDIAGNSDILVLAIQQLANNNEQFLGSITVRQIT